MCLVFVSTRHILPIMTCIVFQLQQRVNGTNVLNICINNYKLRRNYHFYVYYESSLDKGTFMLYSLKGTVSRDKFAQYCIDHQLKPVDRGEGEGRGNTPN